MLHMHNENTPTNTFKIRVSLQLSVQSQCTHVRATTTAYVNVLFLSVLEVSMAVVQSI